MRSSVTCTCNTSSKKQGRLSTLLQLSLQPSTVTIMAGFLRVKQTGMQNDLSAKIPPGVFNPDDLARYGINSQIRCVVSLTSDVAPHPNLEDPAPAPVSPHWGKTKRKENPS